MGVFRPPGPSSEVAACLGTAARLALEVFILCLQVGFARRWVVRNFARTRRLWPVLPLES